MTRQKFWQSRLTSGEPHWPSSTFTSPCVLLPSKLRPDFDALLEDRGHQMVLGDFNAHRPSWFSRTGDDMAAARGEALDWVVNISQLAIANQDLPTQLPSQGQPSPPGDMVHPYLPWVWPSPHNNFLLQSRIPLRTSAKLTGRDLQQLIPLNQPPALLGKKSSGVSSATLEDTIPPAAYPGHPAAYPPGRARPVEIPAGILRPRYWSLLRKLVGKRSSPPPNISIAFDGKPQSSPKVIARAFNRQFTTCSAQHDRAIRRLMRKDLHRHRRVDPSYRTFDERGVTGAIKNASSSTAQGPDGLTMLHLRHLGPHGLAFLTELFNLSVAGISIPAIWKYSVIIPIVKAGKLREQGCSYRTISLLCPAVKILELLFLPSIVEALGTCPSHHCFKPRHSTASALLPISAMVVFGFNQPKPPSRTIVLAVDILKAFDTVSHRLLISRLSTAPNSATTWSDGFWRTSAAGRRCASTSSTTRLLARYGRDSHRGPSSPQQTSSTILCQTAQSPT